MVYVNFPQNLTEEELILKQKYATLKKKVFFCLSMNSNKIVLGGKDFYKLPFCE